MSESAAALPETAGASGALSWRERILAVMRLETLVWTRRSVWGALGACTLVLVCIVVASTLGWEATVPQAGFFLGPPSIVLSLICLGIWTSKEAAGMQQIYGALPVARADIVTGRYLLVLMYSGASLLVVAAWTAAALGVADYRTWTVTLFWLAGMFALSSALSPAFIRYGTTWKAMLIVMGVSAGLSLPIGFIAGLGKSMASSPDRVTVLLGTACLSILLGVMLLLGSWRLSRRLYERQDH